VSLAAAIFTCTCRDIKGSRALPLAHVAEAGQSIEIR
jgi:hypothetical protein